MAGIVNLKLFQCPRLPPSTASFGSSYSRPFPRFFYRPRLPKIFALTRNDIKVGSNIEVEGAPWKVLGKGAAFVRTALRSHVTGNTVEKTFVAVMEDHPLSNSIHETRLQLILDQ